MFSLLVPYNTAYHILLERILQLLVPLPAASTDYHALPTRCARRIPHPTRLAQNSRLRNPAFMPRAHVPCYFSPRQLHNALISLTASSLASSVTSQDLVILALSTCIMRWIRQREALVEARAEPEEAHALCAVKVGF